MGSTGDEPFGEVTSTPSRGERPSLSAEAAEALDARAWLGRAIEIESTAAGTTLAENLTD
jgi:hypothetical protein